MSTRPTGTDVDAGRLLALRAADDALPSVERDALADPTAAESSSEHPYVVAVTDLVERTDFGDGDPIGWSPDDRDRDPMLVFGSIPEDEVDDAGYPRRLVSAEEETYAPVPAELLRVDPGGGLGLDLEAYDPDNPLLFEALATDETIGLIPVRYDDGTPFEAEALPETPAESDPVARETLARDEAADATPRPETADAPIDPTIVREVAAERDVSRDALIGALETIERADVLSIADAIQDPSPVSTGDRAVLAVPSDTWERDVAASVDASETALAAARTAHERQARRLVEAAGATDVADAIAAADRDAAVSAERDTAEWETTDVETS